MTFAEYAPKEVNIGHVTQLLIVHDLVEVHAGDHWELESDAKSVSQKESQAAEQLFGLLPDEQYETTIALWQEFEARETAEAKFAKALDALHPMLFVWGPSGSEKTHVPLTAQQMKELKKPHLVGYPALWRLAEQLLDNAVRRGTLSRS
ncbi:MAG: HD domain-containing protein [Pseudomonadota bacterium]